MASNGKWINPNPRVDDHQTNLALQSLSTYLGGWVDDSGRNPIVYSNGNETRGNAIVFSRYRLVGDICHWYGQYSVGTTTNWAGGAGPICLLPPLLYPTDVTTVTNGSYPVMGNVRAYNTTWNWGFAEAGAFVANAFCLFDAATANTTWSITGARPFAWASTNLLGWNLQYRIQV